MVCPVNYLRNTSGGNASDLGTSGTDTYFPEHLRLIPLSLPGLRNPTPRFRRLEAPWTVPERSASRASLRWWAPTSLKESNRAASAHPRDALKYQRIRTFVEPIRVRKDECQAGLLAFAGRGRAVAIDSEEELLLLAPRSRIIDIHRIRICIDLVLVHLRRGPRYVDPLRRTVSADRLGALVGPHGTARDRARECGRDHECVDVPSCVGCPEGGVG